MNTLYKKFIPPLLIVGVVFAYSSFAQNSLTINWQPKKVETQIFSGGARNIDIVLTSSEALENVKLEVVPELEQFVTIEPNNIELVEKDSPVEVSLNIKVSRSAETDTTIDGVLQIKGQERLSFLDKYVAKILISGKQEQKVIAKPLPIELHILDMQPALNLFEEFLLEEFGTLTPEVDSSSDVGQSIEVPEDILDAFSQGTEESFVLNVGSIKFLGPLDTNEQAETALTNLLTELENKGIRVDNLRTALENHDIYAEGKSDVSGLLLTPGLDATVFFPRKGAQPFSMYKYDEDGNGLTDHYIFVLDNDTHALHRVDHVSMISENNFFNDDDNLMLNPASLIMFHELMHTVIFRTSCFEGDSATEENFVHDLEQIISQKVSSGALFNPLLKSAQETYPEGEDCLDMLGLELVTPPLGESTEVISQTHDNRTQSINSTTGPISQTFLLPEGTKQISKVIIKATSAQASEGPVDVTIAIAPFGLHRCQYDSLSNDCFPTEPMCINGGTVPSQSTACDKWDNKACSSCCTAQVSACAPPGEDAVIQTTTLDASTDIPSGQPEEVEIIFNEPKELTSPQQYALTIIFDNGLNNTIYVAYSDQDPYADGEFRNNSGYDMYFRVFGVVE